MNTIINTQQLSDHLLISFHHIETSGYVGESIYYTKAFLHNMETMEIREIKYEEVKELYNEARSLPKKDRISFWFNMKPMSPKAIEEEMERQHSDVLWRIE